MGFGMARGSAGKRGHPNRPRRQGTALVRTQLARLCACPRTHAHRSVDAAASTGTQTRSEEHTSELQSLMRIPYAVFCWKKKTSTRTANTYNTSHRHEDNPIRSSQYYKD